MSEKKETKDQGFFFRPNAKKGSSNPELINLEKRVGRYFEILQNTVEYRNVWNKSLKKRIIKEIEEMSKAVGLDMDSTVHDKMQNLEAIQFSLGISNSGMAEEIDKNIHRNLIKHNGSLVYQQLFNGKVTVIINYPMIEGYGQPAPPRQLGIYRPEELKQPFFLRHLEEFINDVTNWEDFDDDNPPAHNQQAIGFKLNFEEGA